MEFQLAAFSHIIKRGVNHRALSEPNRALYTGLTHTPNSMMDRIGHPYHSPHKFRHGHVHYGRAHSKPQEGYKAISQNTMQSITGITDQFYSNMGDEEKNNRIDSMFVNNISGEKLNEEYKEFLEFVAWKKARNRQ